jgi:hypothetical protein
VTVEVPGPPVGAVTVTTTVTEVSTETVTSGTTLTVTLPLDPTKSDQQEAADE